MERKIKMVTYCKTFGTTDYTLGNLCSDTECRNCSEFRKLLKEEMQKQITNLSDVNAPGITGNVFVDEEFKPFLQSYKNINKSQIEEAVKYVFRNTKDDE